MARDSVRQRHVLVVRGTFSFTDVYTDILSTTAPVDDPLLQPTNAEPSAAPGENRALTRSPQIPVFLFLFT